MKKYINRNTTPEIKYFLGTFSTECINTFKELTETNYTAYSETMNSIIKLSADENLFNIVELNHVDLNEKIQSYLVNFSNNHKADFYEFDRIFLDINRHILNLLSSIRTFLDHTETTLKKKYGDNSEEYRLFKKEAGLAYDNSFAYRFLYKLRNYAQHCGLPSGFAEVNSSDCLPSEEKDVIRISFVREDLLERYDRWGKIKEELKAQSEKFDVLPLIEEQFQLLNAINDKLKNLILPQYRKEGDLLLNLIVQTAGQIGTPCLIKSVSIKDMITFSFSWFPFDHISRITGAKINIIKL